MPACEEVLDRAVEILFEADPRIQAVGIARHDGAFGFKAVKNAARILPAAALKGVRKPPRTIKTIPVTVETVSADVEAVVAVPYPLTASFVPEQQSHRPLVAGFQVQNVDDDDRQRQAGRLGAGLMTLGTLGCFVRLDDGTAALLSNNHVVAGENRGRKAQDRILQPGALTPSAVQNVAVLTDFVPLLPSPNNARPARGNVIYNETDAAVAALSETVPFTQGFLPSRGLPMPNGIGGAQVGDLHMPGRWGLEGVAIETQAFRGTVSFPLALKKGRATAFALISPRVERYDPCCSRMPRKSSTTRFGLDLQWLPS